MLRDDPLEWALMCRRQAEIHPDPRVSALLLQLADQRDVLAGKLARDGNGSGMDDKPDAIRRLTSL